MSVLYALPAVTQMSTRWHHCSSCICVNCPSPWCPGPSTKTSWTAPTCWTPTQQRYNWFLLEVKKKKRRGAPAMKRVCPFNLSLRAGKSWSNRSHSSPKSTTTFSVTSAGEWNTSRPFWSEISLTLTKLIVSSHLAAFCSRCSCTPKWTRWMWRTWQRWWASTCWNLR